MASPENEFAFDAEAAVEAAQRWQSRRTYHRKISSARASSTPAFSEVESKDRILLRAKRLQSSLKAKGEGAGAASPILVESFSEAGARHESSDAPQQRVDEIMLERVINRTRDFQFTAFLEQALFVANAVCRISTELGGGRKSFGTGFMVTPNLLLTNHHVLPDTETADVSSAEFGYQRNRNGDLTASKIYQLQPGRFYLNDKSLDFALVAVDFGDRDETSHCVWCPMIRDLGKIITMEHINIIQHPRGEPKQVVIRENRLLDSFDGKDVVLHYEADTEPGSSGSPVFNDQWEVVALHHSGVPRIDKDGDMLKRDGNKWRKGDDPDDIDWTANEGIRTSKIVLAVEQASLKGEARDLQQQFLAAEAPSDLADAIPSVTPIRPNGRHCESIRITKQPPLSSLGSAPIKRDNPIMYPDQPTKSSAAYRITVPIHISITVGDPDPVQVHASASQPGNSANVVPDAASELLEKISPDPDYQARKGYDPNFLGFEVPFPKLTVNTRPKAYAIPGQTGDTKYLLNYHHYSLIFNRERYLAFVAGVNYDPNAPFKHQRDKGGDKWFYDPRVTPTEDLQAGDALYAGNPLDRGHLVRRADAAWGKSAREAKLANDDTFHFTNCSPQHEVTNQGKREKAPPGLALWGELEEYVASQGRETAQRLSIFNGPIFRTNDRIYRDVKLPKQYWKVIAFESESGQPAAAAFKLTQAKLIEGLAEAFEFDDYRTVQLSIKELEAETGLNFGKIAAWDTLDDEAFQESFAPGTGIVVLNQLKDIILGD